MGIDKPACRRLRSLAVTSMSFGSVREVISTSEPWSTSASIEWASSVCANGFAIADLSGNTLPNAPEYTFRLGFTYQTAMGDGNLRLRGEGYYQDDVFFTEWNRSDAVQDGYGLINASADYSFGPDGRWMVSLWGRNLSDEEIISNNIITAPLYNSLRVGSMLPPRTYGITGSYAF